MLYEEFERLNCQHIKELEQQNKKIRNVLNVDPFIPNQCKNDIEENDLFRRQFHINGSCIKRNHNNETPTLCGGYDCSTQYFYHTPDKENTFHNYLVLQDELQHNEAVVCTNNHQYYNNWTRRKIPVQPKEKEINTNFLDQYFEPLPKLKYNECKLDDTTYYC